MRRMVSARRTTTELQYGRKFEYMSLDHDYDDVWGVMEVEDLRSTPRTPSSVRNEARLGQHLFPKIRSSPRVVLPLNAPDPSIEPSLYSF